MIKYLGVFTGFTLLSGCAVFNPYASDFTCPGSAKGKCVSVNAAYKESTVTTSAPAEESAKSNELNEEDPGKAEDELCSQHINSDDPANTDVPCVRKKNIVGSKESQEIQNYNRYRSALFDKFGNLLKEPQTPVVSPPKTMRVLLLPYTGQDNEFYMLRYVYFFVDDARWLLGDSVMSNDEEE